MNKRPIRLAGLGVGLAALVAVSVVGLVRYGSGGEAASPPVRSYTVTMKLTKATVADVPTIAVTNLPADAIAYEGDGVEFTIVNESPIDEGFAIDAYGIKEVLKPGETRTARIQRVRAGAYPIYCQLHPLSVHQSGTLLVLPKP
ncbi:MAG: cupredoxin domain-containing protein [Limnochordaceae bacterium]|nr:cupredoxin domain-containing protein [Limnochordaceae bacterium]